jgi:hypothetical protein
MPIDFRSRLDPETRARMDRVRAEVHRLHALPDRFLGRALLTLARRARVEAPERLGKPSDAGYENLLVWSTIPRLAKALGETDFTAEEISLLPLTPEGGQALRDHVGNCLANADLLRYGLKHRSEALQILGHSFVNGNPITSALDRVAPPAPESDDWIARHMREISRNRFGDARFDAWSPAFQSHPARRPDPRPVDDEMPDVVETRFEGEMPEF